MNPAEAAPRDWRLYYHGTMMNHEKKGLVAVSVDDGELYTRKDREDWARTPPTLLSCVWPSPIALNGARGAVYIGRRSRREARRSYTSHHYYIKWGAPTAGITRLLPKMLAPPMYPLIEEAVGMMSEGNYTSVAISRELIVTGTFEVVWKGQIAGDLVHQAGEYFFTPTIAKSAIGRRAGFKLGKEGILCL